MMVGQNSPLEQRALTTQHRFDFCPWYFWRESSAEQQRDQLDWQAALSAAGQIGLGQRCFVSRLAGVYPTCLAMGDESYIAAYAYVTDTVTTGAHCTVNPFAVVRGQVTLGDGVRIGAHSSLLGFNHSFEPDRPVYQQPVTSRGIVVGDDVWIGSHAVVVDGVSIGEHSVIGAGAVVTRDVPPYSVVAGNPARVLRDRRAPAVPAEAGLSGKLAAFGKLARAQWPDVLERCYDADAERYLDRPGAKPTVRAWCDATEIAALFGGIPPYTSAPELIERLQSFQNPQTGLLPDSFSPPDPATDDPALLLDHLSRYHILAVGYALELLGATLRHPIHVVEALDAPRLYDQLARLPWATNAWSAGDWIDCYGAGLYFNLKYFGARNTPEPLLGWLLTHADRYSGMWGKPTPEERWLQPVNGFYRLTRGSYAQFGVPLPYPEQAIDTVLAHGRDSGFFRADAGNACNVLDVIHPLWLCLRQTDYRRAEAQAWARRQLERALGRWQAGAGFSFALELGDDARRTPGLQGSEMWLSIIWLLADLCGESAALEYRPLGVHRPEPAFRISAEV
jgi:acetyltransferase-like isoleucine patch superfamily enzyme